MINYFTNNGYIQLVSFVGILIAFLGTCLFTAKCGKYLPKDQGREFAVNGKLSEGKPRGAGFIFILVFIAAAVIFGNWRTEYFIYLILVAAAMLTGFLDDAAKNPWGEYKKGLLDLIIAIVLAVTFLNFNDSTITIELIDTTFTLPPVVFGILAVILVWVSINVTNCADGVDGLSGTLAITTLCSIYIIDMIKGLGSQTSGDFAQFGYLILLFVVCILGYLWFNATPSKLMMGDAGSRAMGFFISIAVLKTGSPLLYILVAFVLIMDGGLGLIKVALLRFMKIHILKNTRTPLHDHVRKEKNWSNTHTVFRFTIIQIMLCIAAVYLVVI